MGCGLLIYIYIHKSVCVCVCVQGYYEVGRRGNERFQTSLTTYREENDRRMKMMVESQEVGTREHWGSYQGPIR